MSVHYDALAINRNMALDLPFREGVGTITHSIAKTHPLVTIVDVGGVWTTLDSYLQVLTLDGANDYLWASNADTLNLDFTTDNYSIGSWFWITPGGDDDKTLISRFLVSQNGWEIYHYTSLTLQMRHHHAAGGDIRSSCYSENWAFNKWWFMGLSRIGATAQFYRGDIDTFEGILPSFYSALGLEDPESCAQNLIIGANTGGVQNHWNGCIWRPRAWFDRYVTETEWQQIWEKEVEWFRS